MLTVSMQNLSSLINEVSHLNFICVGEIHGIAENAEIVSALIDEMLRQHQQIGVAFEWCLTTTEKENLNQFLNGSATSLPAPAFFADSDGRVTTGHVRLLQKIRDINLAQANTVMVETFAVSGEGRESKMAAVLKRFWLQIQCPVLVETGVVHAAKQGGSLASRLVNDFTVSSIFIEYKSGTVLVEDEVLNVLDAESQQVGPENNFDGVIQVPISHVAKDVDSLTIVE